MIKSSCFFLLFLFASCTVFKPMPQPEQEFRGFWIATVVNIDWPKDGQDAIEKKKQDYLKILNFYEELNFNAAVVQLRTAGDAFYESSYAPWSRFLTGTEGEAEKNYKELLYWMIEETHARGMEFHAWLNPYRATFDLSTDSLSSDHDFNKYPEWMLKYGKKYYYNPGLPKVQEHMVAIIDELVSEYDIDGVHFDDYFYPYTIKDEIFQDSVSYYNYGVPDQSIEDWRRSNIDSLIKKSHEVIKKRKPWVQFGVSPFGVWKNKATDPRGSDTKAGQTTYENLYADPLLWMEQGWLDYVVPQVYWSMDLPVASHRKIVDWWSENSKNTNLYIGNGPYKIRNNSDTAWDNKKELPNQITYARTKTEVKGNVFFSAKSLMQHNNDIIKRLKRNYYKYPSNTPSTSSAQPLLLETPKLEAIVYEENHLALTFTAPRPIRYVLVYRSGKLEKTTYPVTKQIGKVFATKGYEIRLPIKSVQRKKQIALVFVDQEGHKSEPKIILLKQTN